jgi:hypothetical protein
MAGKKLTSDQKRAKRKEAERKRTLQRQHERNRVANQADGLMETIGRAIAGYVGIEQLEDDLSALGSVKVTSPSPSADRFASGAWLELRRVTCRMVELVQLESLEERNQKALEGRIYTIEGGDVEFPWYQPHFMPLEAVRMSRWTPVNAFVRFVAGYEGAPKEGCYFAGFPIGPLAVHFAIASSATQADLPQVYLVTATGWRPLQLERWLEMIYPMLVHALMARELLGRDSTTLAVERLIEKETDADAEFDELILGSELRESIRLLGESLVQETDELARASREQGEARDAERFFSGLLGERSERAAEVEALQRQVADLQAELRRQHASSITAPANEGRANCSPASGVALRSRMTDLVFGQAHG